MVQPKTPPKSFRPGDERWGKIEAHAAKAKITTHAAILALIDLGLADAALFSSPATLKPVIGPKSSPVRHQQIVDGRAVDAEPMHLPRAKYGERLKKPKGK